MFWLAALVGCAWLSENPLDAPYEAPEEPRRDVANAEGAVNNTVVPPEGHEGKLNALEQPKKWSPVRKPQGPPPGEKPFVIRGENGKPIGGDVNGRIPVTNKVPRL